MAQTTLANGASGTVIRNAINNNFTELYARPRVLASSGVKVDLTGSTTETVLATITLPALSANGRIRVTVVYTQTNNANTKTVRGRLNGIAGTAFMSVAQTAILTNRYQFEIINRGATNSQVGNVSSVAWSTSSGSPVTSAIDTSVAVDLVITGQLGVGTDTLSLESYLVEVLVP